MANINFPTFRFPVEESVSETITSENGVIKIIKTVMTTSTITPEEQQARLDALQQQIDELKALLAVRENES